MGRKIKNKRRAFRSSLALMEFLLLLFSQIDFPHLCDVKNGARRYFFGLKRRFNEWRKELKYGKSFHLHVVFCAVYIHSMLENVKRSTKFYQIKKMSPLLTWKIVFYLLYFMALNTHREDF